MVDDIVDGWQPRAARAICCQVEFKLIRPIRLREGVPWTVLIPWLIRVRAGVTRAKRIREGSASSPTDGETDYCACSASPGTSNPGTD